MRVFKRSALGSLYPLPDGLDFTPAMSTRALYEDLRMVEVPIPYRERVGRSKLNVTKDGLRFFRSIMWTATLYNPLGIFGAVGLLALLVGAGARFPTGSLLRPAPQRPGGLDLPPDGRARAQRRRRERPGLRVDQPCDLQSAARLGANGAHPCPGRCRSAWPGSVFCCS